MISRTKAPPKDTTNKPCNAVDDRTTTNAPLEVRVDANSRRLEGVELGDLPRIGLRQEGIGANQPFQDGG